MPPPGHGLRLRHARARGRRGSQEPRRRQRHLRRAQHPDRRRHAASDHRRRQRLLLRRRRAHPVLRPARPVLQRIRCSVRPADRGFRHPGPPHRGHDRSRQRRPHHPRDEPADRILRAQLRPAGGPHLERLRHDDLRERDRHARGRLHLGRQARERAAHPADRPHRRRSHRILMRFIPGLLALGFLVILPTGLSGRQHGCNLIRSGDWNIFNAGAPNEVVFMGGPVHFECDGGITVKADSAVRMPERLQLIGQVFYGDSVKTLTSRQLDYFPREGRLFARGDVEYLDRATGSTIQGQELHHERESAVRAESRTVVQGRPHGVFRPQRRDGAAADTATQPFEVDAEWMEFIGQRAFRASGNVELVRGALRGFSNWAEFDNETERLVLTGSARVLDEQYELTAERIEAVPVGAQLSELFASTNARLTGENVTIESYEIRMFTDDGALSRLVARTRGGLPDPNASRGRATPAALLLLADSLDGLAPGQRIETLIAVGRAYAERTADTVDVGLPEIAAKDWVRGDTITGHFAPATKAADPDTAASAA